MNLEKTMNILRSASNVQNLVPKPAPINDFAVKSNHYPSKSTGTFEGLVGGGDIFPESPLASGKNIELGGGNVSSVKAPSSKTDHVAVDKFSQVSEREGSITIPRGKLPDGWSEAPGINSLRSLDRSFVFPGERIHILACLSVSKPDAETITPFKVAAMLSENDIEETAKLDSENVKHKRDVVCNEGETNSVILGVDQNLGGGSNQRISQDEEIHATEALLRVEDHKKQTEAILEKFKDSHFFVRIAESGEPLWSKKTPLDLEFQKMGSENSIDIGNNKMRNNMFDLNTHIDRGEFDANFSGGAARNCAQCFSLSNGDIVVVLEVNVGVNFLKDPVIEILQFEKYQERNMPPDEQVIDYFPDEQVIDYSRPDPYGDLLKWLLPVKNNAPPARSFSSLFVNSSSGSRSIAQMSVSIGSQPLSHIRSYSMSSLPRAQPSLHVELRSSKPSFDLQDIATNSSQTVWKTKKTAGEELLSFRGVSLEQERYAVCCGLEGICFPGRSWRRKLEIVQPLEINSIAIDCNADDLLCVQIKNVSPSEAPDIVIYVDYITIIIEEVSEGGPYASLPMACVHAGNEQHLPNLALRRGEQHSFILKPVPSTLKNYLTPPLDLRLVSNTYAGRRIAPVSDRYAIMVSCRCNYTESRLFFKQPTSWKPRVSRGLKISVTSAMSGRSVGPYGRQPQLQVLTLLVSNLTSEDLTLTVLAPASFSSPSVGSLSSPKEQTSEIVVLSDTKSKINGEKHSSELQMLSSGPPASENQLQNSDTENSSNFVKQQSFLPGDIPSTCLTCTHLWLQSRVPLGCVPAHSMSTVKLELLPLTNRIIRLDNLQIDVQGKGSLYIPEHSLKIYITPSTSAGNI